MIYEFRFFIHVHKLLNFLSNCFTKKNKNMLIQYCILNYFSRRKALSRVFGKLSITVILLSFIPILLPGIFGILVVEKPYLALSFRNLLSSTPSRNWSFNQRKWGGSSSLRFFGSALNVKTNGNLGVGPLEREAQPQRPLDSATGFKVQRNDQRQMCVRMISNNWN